MRRPEPHAVTATTITLAALHVLLLLLCVQGPPPAGAAFQLPPFLQTLSEHTLSQSRADGSDRLFTLPSSLANVPNVRRFTPRKKHLKPHKLRRRLRKDWDPFWMSAERPEEALVEVVREAPRDPSLVKAVERLNFTLRGGGEDGEPGGSLEESVTRLLGAWLLQRSTCRVHYVWDDLGVLYWPRWVRRGFCQADDDYYSSSSSSASSASSLSPSSSSSSASSSSSSSSFSATPSCSWPPGMHCVPAESRRIRILRWQCRHNKAFNNWNPRFRTRRPRRPKARGEGPGTGRGRSRRDVLARDALARDALARRNHTERAAAGGGDDESNETENWSRKPFQDRRRKLSMRCKWKKIPYPVTDDCFCSC